MQASTGEEASLLQTIARSSVQMRAKLRRLTSRWYLVAVLVLTPLVFVSNLYFKGRLLYGGGGGGGGDHFDWSTNASRHGRQHGMKRLAAMKAVRQRPCPVDYFVRRSFHHNATVERGERVMTSRESDDRRSPDLLSRYNSTISHLDIPPAFNSSFLNPCWYEPPGGGGLRCLPYFFLAGFPKCGTTDLYYKMALHPQIQMASRKEPHWWTRKRIQDAVNDTAGLSSAVSLADYEKLFARSADCMEKVANLHLSEPIPMITGDGSASTVWDNRYLKLLPDEPELPEPRLIAADLIRYYLPDSRILVIVRDPVYRLFSDYLYFWNDKRSSPSAEDFHEKVKDAIHSVRECLRNQSIKACVHRDVLKTKVRIKVGLYSVYLRDWFEVFPSRQIHVLRTEDYAASPEKELKKIFTFLGLDPLKEAIYENIRKMPRINQQTSPSAKIAMLPDTDVMLRHFYAPFNTDLALLLNNTDYLWLNSQR